MINDYKPYVKDGDMFYIVHDLVQMIDRTKGFDARYDSKEAHNGKFTVKYDGKDYIVTICNKSPEFHDNNMCPINLVGSLQSTTDPGELLNGTVTAHNSKDTTDQLCSTTCSNNSFYTDNGFTNKEKSSNSDIDEYIKALRGNINYDNIDEYIEVLRSHIN